MIYNSESIYANLARELPSGNKLHYKRLYDKDMHFFVTLHYFLSSLREKRFGWC